SFGEDERERAYRREASELRALVESAQRAQGARRVSAEAPVLAGFVVNWDPSSLRSLEAHADQLTHVMPEWIRVAPGGQFLVDEDARVSKVAAHLELTPTVSNYGGGRFRRELALPLIATPAARADAALRLRLL